MFGPKNFTSPFPKCCWSLMRSRGGRSITCICWWLMVAGNQNLFTLPMASMGLAYLPNIYHIVAIKNNQMVGRYTMTMDAMGKVNSSIRWFKPWPNLIPKLAVSCCCIPLSLGHVNSPSQKGHKEFILQNSLASISLPVIPPEVFGAWSVCFWGLKNASENKVIRSLGLSTLWFSWYIDISSNTCRVFGIYSKLGDGTI